MDFTNFTDFNDLRLAEGKKKESVPFLSGGFSSSERDQYLPACNCPGKAGQVSETLPIWCFPLFVFFFKTVRDFTDFTDFMDFIDVIDFIAEIDQCLMSR